MKQFGRIFLFGLCLFAVLYLPAAAVPQTLIPGGEAVGLELLTDGVYVAGFSEPVSPAKDAGVRIGDRIEQLDGKPVTTVEDIPGLLDEAQEQVTLQVRRGAKRLQLSLTPQQFSDGRRLGLQVRGSVAGIGTVTYYDPESGGFGALGHAVNDPGGKKVPLRTGTVLPVTLEGIRKGETGAAGALTGSAADGRILGRIEQNLAQGVFGSLDEIPDRDPLPVAELADLRQGPAMIRCTVDRDGLREYSIEITAVRPRDPNHRSLQLRVTDPLLLQKTGGIVQGISGAPILQDGKLVGAVTHVLLDDPSRGYGIYIGDMLQALEKAA